MNHVHADPVRNIKNAMAQMSKGKQIMKHLFFVISIFCVSHNMLASQSEPTIKYVRDFRCKEVFMCKGQEWPRYYRKEVDGKIVERVALSCDVKANKLKYAAQALKSISSDNGEVRETSYYLTPQSAEQKFKEHEAACNAQKAAVTLVQAQKSENK